MDVAYFSIALVVSAALIAIPWYFETRDLFKPPSRTENTLPHCGYGLGAL
jgi:hypothetical protein